MSPQTNGRWDETRLLQLIQDGIEESAELEYKGAGALKSDQKAKEEITKDVSAMANAAGGTIIYGLAEFQDPVRKHLPEKIDPVNRTQFSKEWLEQIVGQIRPRIPDLQIHPVQLSTGINDAAYVVEIPQGSTAHQALTLKYHRRYNFEAVPMLDHEIRDVMNRRKVPHLVVKARFGFFDFPGPEDMDGRLVFDIENQSDVFARYVSLVTFVPLRVQRHLIAYRNCDYTLWEDEDGLASYKLTYSNLGGTPLFPRSRLMAKFPCKYMAMMNPEPERKLDRFKYEVFADSMSPQHGEFTFDEIFQK